MEWVPGPPNEFLQEVEMAERGGEGQDLKGEGLRAVGIMGGPVDWTCGFLSSHHLI